MKKYIFGLFWCLLATGAWAQNPTTRIGFVIPSTGSFNYPQLIAANYETADSSTAVVGSTTTSNTFLSSTTFTGSVSTVTINQDLKLNYIPINSVLGTNANGDVVNVSVGGGGTPALAIYNGTSGATGVAVSTPTSGINLESANFLVALQGGSTAYITPKSSTFTLQGNSFNGNNQLTQTNGSGLLPTSTLGNAILNQGTLQVGATFYTSSGTVNNLQTSTATVQTLLQVNGVGLGSAQVVGQINGAALNVLGNGFVGLGTAAPGYALDEQLNTANFKYGQITSTITVSTMTATGEIIFKDGSTQSTAAGAANTITLSSFTALQPVLYNNSTGQFSSTLISLSSGVTGNLPAASIAAGNLGSAVIASSLSATSGSIGQGSGVSVTGTWPNQTVATSGSFINNQNTLQAGATFYVSSGTVTGAFTAGSETTGGLTVNGFSHFNNNTFVSLSSILDVNGELEADGLIQVFNNQGVQLFNPAATHWITFYSTPSATYNLWWPPVQGGASTVLQNDGSGNLSWATVSAGGGTSVSTATVSSVAYYQSSTTVGGLSYLEFIPNEPHGALNNILKISGDSQDPRLELQYPAGQNGYISFTDTTSVNTFAQLIVDDAGDTEFDAVGGQQLLTAAQDIEFVSNAIGSGFEWDMDATGVLTTPGSIAMSANKITGLANGTASTDAAAFGQVIHLSNTLQTGATFYVSSGTAVSFITSTTTVSGEIILKDGTIITSTSTFGGGGSGTVTNGTAGNLALYPASTASVGTLYSQNSHSIQVSITSQPSRGTNLNYSLPNPGDGIAAASFILDSESAPTAQAFLFSGPSGTILGAVTTSTTSPTALDMGTHKITSLTNGSSAQDAAAFGQIPVFHAPTVQSFISGSGTYTLPTSPTPLYIRVHMVGGGGGGSGSGTSGGGNGSNGTSTTFGALTAGLGAGGTAGGAGGTGGSNTTGGTTILNIQGGAGATGFEPSVSAVQLPGTMGGSTPYGGGARSAGANATGASGQNGTGEGGQGGGIGLTGTDDIGSGGGAGGYLEAILTSPSATYSYGVGSGGNGGSAGSSGQGGGAGGSGTIVVEEYYQ